MIDKRKLLIILGLRNLAHHILKKILSFGVEA